jgi:predicted O-linked N-acetylglucosamine transferase (SPINDLY family)
MFKWIKKISRPESVSSGSSISNDPINASVSTSQGESIQYKMLADSLFESGKFHEAIHNYKIAVYLHPHFAEAHINLSNVLREQSMFNEAEHHLRLAIQYNPQQALAYYNLGSLLLEQGNHNDAITHLNKSIELKRDLTPAFIKIGHIQLEANNLNEALLNFLRAIELEPNYAPAYVNIGNIYCELGSPDAALTSYKMALEFDQSLMESHLNIGVLLSKQGKIVDAISHFQTALAIEPEFVDAHYHLGLACVAQEKIKDACDNFRKALSFSPDHLAALGGLAHQMQHMCEWRDLQQIIDKIRRITLLAPYDSSDKNWIAPFTYMALPGINAHEQKVCTEKYVRRTYLNCSSTKPSNGSSGTINKKITIGYLSSDFHDHATSRLIAQIFELHDRKKFNIIAFSYVPDDGSTMRNRLSKSFDEFVDIRKFSTVDAANAIYEKKIDILVDLKGYTQNTRSEILALRPAPIQVNYLGYPGTLGAKYVDYILADRTIIPTEHFKYYTEKVMWLKDCYQPSDQSRRRLPAPKRSECGLPDGAFVFCCFNQTYKITPEFFEVWCRLLKSVPQSILWLLSTNQFAEANLKNNLAQHEIDPNRIVMAPFIDGEKHLARLQCADLFLDTSPVNAHTTCSDSLWMGLPIITCIGDTFPSRVAASLLKAIDIPELITDSLESYYSLALKLSTEVEFMNAIRKKILLNRDNSFLFDSHRFTRNLETAYTKMMADRI